MRRHAIAHGRARTHSDRRQWDSEDEQEQAQASLRRRARAMGDDDEGAAGCGLRRSGMKHTLRIHSKLA